MTSPTFLYEQFPGQYTYTSPTPIKVNATVDRLVITNRAGRPPPDVAHEIVVAAAINSYDFKVTLQPLTSDWELGLATSFVPTLLYELTTSMRSGFDLFALQPLARHPYPTRSASLVQTVELWSRSTDSWSASEFHLPKGNRSRQPFPYYAERLLNALPPILGTSLRVSAFAGTGEAHETYSLHRLSTPIEAFQERLTAQELEVAVLRWGWKGREHSLSEIARKLRISKERVRQVEARTLRRVGRYSRRPVDYVCT